MQFQSAAFAGFFLLVFMVHWAVAARPRWRLVVLLLASYAFYAGFSWPALAVLVAMTLLNFTAVRVMQTWPQPRVRRWAMAVVVAASLGNLAMFKYAGFLTTNVVGLAESWFGLTIPWSPPTLWSLVGVSFYTFQAITYTVDVYRGSLTERVRLLDMAAGIAFFPTILSGPITRGIEWLPQLSHPATFSLANGQTGLVRFFVGLLKKVVLADALAETIVAPAFGTPTAASGGHLWLAIYAYAFQLYLDFSAYSDMAIGAARMLGITLPENFDRPYQAASLREFWKRWHMSLSRFLRDYLYISLGGNRGPAWQTYRNLMLTMLLGGLWHGAAWTFVAWGAIHGLLLCWEHARGNKSLVPSLHGRAAAPPRWRHVLAVLATFHWVCLAWLFFRADRFEDVWIILSRIATWAPRVGDLVVLRERGVWILILAAVLHFVPRSVPELLTVRVARWSPLAQGMAAAVVVAVVGILGSVNQPFLYFQF
jgi:D-alanyl-lipoteichoic acid acyltransferase DltB (MBOAT superfamily)